MLNFTTLQIPAMDWLSRQWQSQFRSIKTMPTMPRCTIDDVTLALHKAYQQFAQTYPTWAQRGVDDRFLYQVLMPCLAQHYCTPTRTQQPPTGMTVALAWNRQFGPLIPEIGLRLRQQSALTTVADDLLRMIAGELATYGSCPSRNGLSI